MITERLRSLPTGIRLNVRHRLLDDIFENKYCSKCKLYSKVKHPYIVGRGNRESNILIVGETPGANEDAQGEVFIGKSGQFLQNKLDYLGMDCFITNAVKCRSVDSDGKNKTPTTIPVKSCKPFTIKIIDEMRPTVILTLGRIAMSQVLNVNMSIEVARGKVFYHPQFKCSVIPTYHPMALLYNNDALLYKQFDADLRLAKDLLERPRRRILPARPRSLKDPLEIKEYLCSLFEKDAVALDLETEGLDFKTHKITDISLCGDVGYGVHIKWSLIVKHCWDELEKFLLSDVRKILMNGKFDWKFLRAVGLDLNNYYFDVMSAEHTLTMSIEGRATAGLYKLDTMTWLYTNLGGFKAVLGKGGIAEHQKKSKAGVDSEKKKETTKQKKEETPPSEVEQVLNRYNTYIEDKQNQQIEGLGVTPFEYYSALDSDATLRVYTKQKPLIDKDYKEVFYSLRMPLLYVLMRMEENGMRLDLDYMNKIKEENDAEMAKILKKLYKKVGFEFNINSTQQLADVMFKHLGVKPNEDMKTPKTGAYTLNQTALEYYSKQQPTLKSILDYRALGKQSSTYVEGFKKYMDPETWRVHPTFMETSTATGRLSVIEPAIQTIPRDNRIRKMVVPSPGNKLIIADLSQVELRILAQVSDDMNMISAFKSGADIHAATACNALLHIPIKDFDKENTRHSEARTISKTINFGIVYGLSAYSLANDLDYPMKTTKERMASIDKAQRYIDNWFRLYSDAATWLEDIQGFALRFGYVESLYGRRRYLPKVYSSDTLTKESALRQARNMPIQSLASDVNNIGLIRFQKWLDDTNKKAKLIGVVHDSILCDTPEDEVEEAAEKLVECMITDMPKITIPLKADVDILDRWIKT